MVHTAIKPISQFNIFVERISKKKWKILDNKNIEKILSQIMWEKYTRTKSYKMVHQANIKWHLIILKKDLYYVPHANEEETAVIANWYRQILHMHIKQYLWGKWLITGATALQLYLNNYEIPDVISLLSPNKQCQEIIVRDKVTNIKMMNSWWSSLFPILKKTAKKTSIRWKSFYTTSLIVSLLETFYANDNQAHWVNELGKKILRKYWKLLDWEEATTLLRKGKYHTSINKIYQLSRSIDDTYADFIMWIIKKHSYRISF
jgi:hypothetical protein